MGVSRDVLYPGGLDGLSCIMCTACVCFGVGTGYGYHGDCLLLFCDSSFFGRALVSLLLWFYCLL